MDMFMNDFDDKLTEEQALTTGESEDQNAEIFTSLQNEASMSLEDLIALHKLSAEEQGHESSFEQGPDYFQSAEKQEIKTNQPFKLNVPYNPVPENNQESSGALSSVSDEDEHENEDENEEVEYGSHRGTFRRHIMVGIDFQPLIPDRLCPYDDALLPYENEDKLLWDPYVVESEFVEEFLHKAFEISKPVLPRGNHLRDDEQALCLLQQCSYNSDEALKLLCMDVSSRNARLWSKEECNNFECGLESFGKVFHLIQQCKVPTKSVGEVVQFYYLWKKTEKYDIFLSKTKRFEHKRSNKLNLDKLTDSVNRFFENQANSSFNRKKSKKGKKRSKYIL